MKFLLLCLLPVVLAAPHVDLATLKCDVQVILDVVGSEPTEMACESECHKIVQSGSILNHGCPLVCHIFPKENMNNLLVCLLPLLSLISAAPHSASPPDECYTTASHKQYTGRWNITETGRPCQAFTAQLPHAHVFTGDSLYPDGTIAAAGNNCRDPDNAGFLWCYTLDPAKRWESCDINRCTEDNCFIYSTFQAATVNLGVYEYYQALP